MRQCDPSKLASGAHSCSAVLYENNLRDRLRPGERGYALDCEVACHDEGPPQLPFRINCINYPRNCAVSYFLCVTCDSRNCPSFECQVLSSFFPAQNKKIQFQLFLQFVSILNSFFFCHFSFLMPCFDLICVVLFVVNVEDWYFFSFGFWNVNFRNRPATPKVDENNCKHFITSMQKVQSRSIFSDTKSYNAYP